MTAASLFQSGDVLQGRYRVDRLLGKGGMGEVYAAADLLSGQEVALKSLLPELVDSVKATLRLEREAEFSRIIAHPNVLKIFAVFRVRSPAAFQGESLQEVPCMAMELLHGSTLADRLQPGGRLAPEEARLIFSQTAAALTAVHAAHIVHRDLKPDNLFLTTEPQGLRVVLADFGVARFSHESEDSADARADGDSSRDPLTASNVVLGTPSYMAPEQLELEQALPASDVYALGLIMYETITGVFPFQHEVPIQAVFRRVHHDPEPPRRHLPDLDPRWNRLILHCLERRADRRPTASEVVTALTDLGQSEPMDAFADDAAQLPSWALAVVGCVLVLALIIFFLVNF